MENFTEDVAAREEFDSMSFLMGCTTKAGKSVRIRDAEDQARVVSSEPWRHEEVEMVEM